jgi:hypothetical protein
LQHSCHFPVKLFLLIIAQTSHDKKSELTKQRRGVVRGKNEHKNPPVFTQGVAEMTAKKSKWSVAYVWEAKAACVTVG